MVSIVLSMLVASMDTTIINTTMGYIAKDLGGFELYAWSFASYMIMATVVSPVAGRISDLYGRKKIFAAGILIFLAGSILCGAANTMLQLVVFRTVQGLGAGIMMPFPAIIAGDLFAVENRGKIQALFTGMWGLSAVLAPLLGAALVEYSSWRWIFLINIPICIVSVILLTFYKEVYHPKKSKIDILGALLFAAAISLLLLTTTARTYEFVYAAGGLLALILFYLYERRHPSPVIPLSMLRNPPIAWMIINGFLSCIALFGSSSYIPLFLQEQNYSLFMSGLALLGMSIGWMAVSVPSGKWIVRYGYSRLMIIGNVFLVLSAAMLFLMRHGHGFWYVFAAMGVQGLAFGLTSTVSTIGSQQLVEPHQKGISTSLQLFSRNIGTAMGVTIMGAFLNQAANFYAGIHHLFVYGLIASLIAFGSSLMIRRV
ncbi:DeoR faimly transcriptional regulator [Cohnella kolymensis]|uniref:MFS-type drug efflux transporter P55 n=1 Tax=Cohnella kolymensis TaxID=1590652 RepID=A0ABR5A1H3_9BACL|nr:MFS transporter [Cohnella kolymensis]KIL34907.1 DeoR faimly transcriptional regulator [Cohnella kolymensis]